jgi:hypothetical protein
LNTNRIVHFGYLAALAATVVIAVLLARSWADHVRDDAKADAQMAADKVKTADAQQAIVKIESEHQATVQALQQQIEALKKHPEQAPQVIRDSGIFKDPPKVVPDVTLPDTPAPQIHKGDIELNPEQQQQLAQFALSCRKCMADSQAAEAKLEEKDKIIAGKDDELQAQARALKGGSVWQRFKRRGTTMGCAAGGAAVGAEADRKSPAIGAAGGAVAGTLACLISGH